LQHRSSRTGAVHARRTRAPRRPWNRRRSFSSPAAIRNPARQTHRCGSRRSSPRPRAWANASATASLATSRSPEKATRARHKRAPSSRYSRSSPRSAVTNASCNTPVQGADRSRRCRAEEQIASGNSAARSTGDGAVQNSRPEGLWPFRSAGWRIGNCSCVRARSQRRQPGAPEPSIGPSVGGIERRSGGRCPRGAATPPRRLGSARELLEVSSGDAGEGPLVREDPYRTRSNRDRHRDRLAVEVDSHDWRVSVPFRHHPRVPGQGSDSALINHQTKGALPPVGPELAPRRTWSRQDRTRSRPRTRRPPPCRDARRTAP
jgi:hypothetical protein